jgi:tRNA(Ile)-lysidine synthase
MTDMRTKLSAEKIFSPLGLPSPNHPIVVAYSGGLDSHVLLHLLYTYSQSFTPTLNLTAVHINHGLNHNAGAWADHCRTVCLAMNIDYQQLDLDARAPQGESQEAWARKLRYEALQPFIQPGTVLMTAHHQDDMAETLLIQLFRGSGPAGLAAMPVQATFGQGLHLRPLLEYPRSELWRYAQDHHLVWVEDDSNADHRYDRNLLRNSILPAVRQRWPAISRTLYRAARLQAGAASLLDELGNIDMQACTINNGRELRVSALLQLSGARASNMLRYWIRSRGFPLPTERRLTEIFSSVIAAGPDANPCVRWKGTELRRYRDYLFINPMLPAPPEPLLEINWDMDMHCELVLGTLHAYPCSGEGLSASKCSKKQISVRYRRGDELIKAAGHHHRLRKLYQQYGVASCYRDYVPLLYAADTLIAIPGLVIADDYRAMPDESGWEIVWTESTRIRPGSLN